MWLTNWATLGNNWATFNSNIWSQLKLVTRLSTSNESSVQHSNATLKFAYYIGSRGRSYQQNFPRKSSLFLSALIGYSMFSSQSEYSIKAHSHYCVFRVRLRQTVALLRRDRKIPISALTQSTAESADRCGECESALTA